MNLTRATMSSNEAAATISSDLATLPMPASENRTAAGTRARRQEGEALRRYQTAIAAARESLRRAEERFDESSSAIDAHIQWALAADARRGSRCPLQPTASSAPPLPSSPPRAAARTPTSAARSTPSPVPSRSLA